MATRKTRVATLLSVVVIGRLEPVGPRKNLSQLRRIVDQDRKVLRADKEPRTFVLERNQGNLVRVPFTDQTKSIISRHAHISRFNGNSGPTRRIQEIDSDGKINKGRIVSART